MAHEGEEEVLRGLVGRLLRLEELKLHRTLTEPPPIAPWYVTRDVPGYLRDALLTLDALHRTVVSLDEIQSASERHRTLEAVRLEGEVAGAQHDLAIRLRADRRQEAADDRDDRLAEEQLLHGVTRRRARLPLLLASDARRLISEDCSAPESSEFERAVSADRVRLDSEFARLRLRVDHEKEFQQFLDSVEAEFASVHGEDAARTRMNDIRLRLGLDALDDESSDGSEGSP